MQHCAAARLGGRAERGQPGAPKLGRVGLNFRLAREIVARRLSVDYRQQSAFRCTQILILLMGCLTFLPALGWATDFDIIGGSEPQKRLVSCVADASTTLLRETAGPRQPMTFVI